MQTLDLNPTVTIGYQSLSDWHAQFRDHMLKIDAQCDPSHRIDHVDRVMKNAHSINLHEHGNMAIIVPAVMLHDCVPIDKRSPQRAQASRLSAEAAIEHLQQWHYPDQYYSDIVHAIACHSFSANLDPTTLEAKIVQDADRLDSLGAIGIARTFMLAGKFNNTLYHADDPFVISREPNDSVYAIDHFYRKLLTLKAHFNTPTGRHLATQRTQLMKRYLDDLAGEL